MRKLVLTAAVAMVAGQTANAHQLPHRKPMRTLALSTQKRIYRREVLHAVNTIEWWLSAERRWCFDGFHPACALVGGPDLGHHRQLLRNAKRKLHQLQRLIAQRAASRRAARRARQRTSTIGGWASVIAPYRAWLASVRACESGGNYRAVSPDGLYTGAYQFDDTTWHGVGGSTSRAMYASPIEQDYRAVLLRRLRGTSPWPNCG